MHLLNINGALDSLGDVRPEYKIFTNGVEISEGASVPEVKFVWIGMSMKRVYFRGKYDPNQKTKPFCSSSDGVTPDGGTDPMPGPCQQCEYSRFTRMGDHSEPPACQARYDMYCFDVDRKNPFILSDLKKKAITELKKLKQSLYMHAAMSSPGYPTNLGLVIRLSTRNEQFGINSFAVPQFQIIGKAEEQITKMLFSASKNFIDMLVPPWQNKTNQIETKGEPQKEVKEIDPGWERKEKRFETKAIQAGKTEQWQSKADWSREVDHNFKEALPGNCIDWHTFLVPCKSVRELSWEKLALDPILQNGMTGRKYLEELSKQTQYDDLAFLAKKALYTDFSENFGEPPF